VSLLCLYLVLGGLTVGQAPTWLRAHEASRAYAGLGVTLAALGAALLMVSNRLARLGAAILLLLFAAFAGIHSSLFVDHFVHDPLLAIGSNTAPSPGALALVGEQRLARMPGTLRLSEDGSRFAAGAPAYDNDDDDNGPIAGPNHKFTVGTVGGGFDTLAAQDVAFVDGKRTLAIARAQDGRLELQLLSADDLRHVDRSWPLPPELRRAALNLNAGAWRVEGQQDEERAHVVVRGRIDASETSVERWAGSTFEHIVAGVGPEALVTRLHYQKSATALLPFPSLDHLPGRWELIWRSEGHDTSLLTSTLRPDCRALTDGYVCVTHFEDRCHVIRISGGGIQPVLAVDSTYLVAATAEGRVVLGGHSSFTVVDVASRRAATHALERTCHVLAAAGPFIGEACAAGVVRVYRTK
jgi:hypothetical protein